MNVALWIVQALLALGFLATGGMKLFLSVDELVANQIAFVTSVPIELVRFIGLAEVLGALGLILPAALKIQPKLTPIAAALLTFVMVLAVGVHLILGHLATLPAPIVFGLLAGFVAWGRWFKVPITAR